MRSTSASTARRGLAAEHTRLDHARVVEDRAGRRLEQRGQVAKSEVLERRAVHMQQAAGRRVRRRRLRDQLRRQLVVEIGKAAHPVIIWKA